MITIGIPTLNRYDLLLLALRSAEQGTVIPDKYLIIDNGNEINKSQFEEFGNKLEIYQPGINLGCAGGWNKIIDMTTDIRIISNDDVIFHTDTIELLVNSFVEDALLFPAGIPAANVFSCFLLPDAVIKKIGNFDEKISPNYAYFEDNDYDRRLRLAGLNIVGVEGCRLGHNASSTFDYLTPIQKENHHKKFRIAKQNYIKKWGGEPGKEKLTVPNG